MGLRVAPNKVLEEIEHARNEIVNLACELVKIKSVNPPGDVSEIAFYLKDVLERNGLTVYTMEPEKGRVNVISSIGSNKPELVFNGHTDVVPPGDLSKWSIDPFSGVVMDGYLYGRGASDMKGGLAALIGAFLVLAKHESGLNGRVTLVAVPDEETGGFFGTRYLVENDIVLGDYVIIGEPTGMNYIDIGQRGMVWLKLKSRGVSAHGSLAPYVGANAILKMVEAVQVLLEKVTSVTSSLPPDIAPVVSKSEKLADELLGVDGIGEKILRRPSFNVGIIKGGHKVNVVPDYCEAEVDIRLPIGVPKEVILVLIDEVVKKFNVEIELMTAFDANYTLPETRLVKELSNSIRTILGIEPSLFVQWASSDARFYRSKNVPTVHYGPAVLEGIHGYNEKVKIADIVNAAKVYALTALRILS
ncbi:MAG: ArgE/DapE family deacylase [Desulfurococcaceae archaeon]